MLRRAPSGNAPCEWRLSYPALFCLALLLTDVSSGTAQATRAVVAPGSRVRVTAPQHGLDRAIGIVRDTTNGILRVEFLHSRARGAHADSTIARSIDRSSIADWDVYTGLGGNAGKGARVGLLVGFAIGAVIAYNAGSGRGEVEDCSPGQVFCIWAANGTFLSDVGVGAEERAVLGGFVGAAAGAALGGLVGATIRTERWRRVRGARFVQILPVRGGVTLSASVRF